MGRLRDRTPLGVLGSALEGLFPFSFHWRGQPTWAEDNLGESLGVVENLEYSPSPKTSALKSVGVFVIRGGRFAGRRSQRNA